MARTVPFDLSYSDYLFTQVSPFQLDPNKPINSFHSSKLLFTKSGMPHTTTCEHIKLLLCTKWLLLYCFKRYMACLDSPYFYIK